MLPGGQQGKRRWLIAGLVAFAVFLALMFNEARNRPGQATAPKSVPLQNPK
jgi:hypothetical protein